MRLLRGLPVEDIATPAAEPRESKKHERGGGYGGHHKRRRVAGEDDTERDIRYAKEDQEVAVQRAEPAPLRKPKNVRLTDSDGHINLLAAEATRQQKPTNPEAAAEEAKKKREFEDQYTMRFSNAAGFKQDVSEQPWYSAKSGRAEDANEAPGKNVWGKDDPRRRKRDKVRLAADDPMAAMQKGVQGVRRVEKERLDWRRERQKELDDLVREEKRKRKRSRKHDDSDLEDFRLEETVEPASKASKACDRHHHRHKHHEENSRHRRHRHEGERASPRPHGRRAMGRLLEAA